MSVMDIPTLADCGCKAKVYSDGSGVDIEYCDLHRSARDLLKAAQDVIRWFGKEDDTALWIAIDALETAVDKATGQYIR